MDGGAWPFLVGGVICLVNSDNERDSPLLNSRLDLDSRVMRPGGVFSRLCAEGDRVCAMWYFGAACAGAFNLSRMPGSPWVVHTPSPPLML